MRKFLFLVPIGLLVIWMGGCGSDSANNQASPTPSTSPSGASPSPAATSKAATPSPKASINLPFALPLVTPKSNGSIAAAGLTQSTNPDERARQAQSGNSKNTPILPNTNPNQDPFAVLTPQTVQNAPIAQSASGSTGSLLPKLPNRQVPLLPPLPVSMRPPQIGGAKLTGADAGQIRLSPLAQSVVNDFTTFHNLLDSSTTFADYTTEIKLLKDIIKEKDDSIDLDERRNSTRRQLLLTNRPLFRRLEKALGEYENAEELWRDRFGNQSPNDTLRCSIVPVIAEYIQIYRPPTQRLGQLQCVKRIDMLQTVWRRGKNILDAALRDQDFDGPTIAKAPNLPVLTEDKPLVVAGEKALGRDIAQLPQIPGINPPPLGINVRRRGPGNSPLGPGNSPVGPIDNPPPLPVAPGPLGVPDLPELPVDKRPPQWVDPNPRRQQPGRTLPPPPNTDIATGIEVSGVVKVGNEIFVIIKVPSEATSRYVKVGQRLGNGQVLVKRIDIKPGQDPIVILEQNGVEIAKVVGEKSVTPDQKSNNIIVRKPGNNNGSTRR